MFWNRKPRAAQRLVIEVTAGIGEMTKRYRLEVPANTTFDDIEGLLMIVGAIPQRVTVTVGLTPH